MDGTAIKELRDLIRHNEGGERVQIHGVTYSTSPLQPVMRPMPASLQLKTLSGLCDYLELEADQMIEETGSCIVHVVSPAEVRVHGGLDDARNRELRAFASYSDPLVGLLDTRIDLDRALVLLATVFASTSDGAELASLIGTLDVNEGVRYEDDGLSQSVTTRRGAALKSKARVKAGWTLSPRRTFPEVEQPECRFVVRLQTDGGIPTVSFYEADGGFWRVGTVRAIAEWISERVRPQDRCITVIA